MNLPLTGSVTKNGYLEIGGCDMVALARKYGTPLYVMDERDLRSKCLYYKKVFTELYPNTEFVFASKALSVIGVLKVIADEGFGADVVSGGELATALKAGIDPKKIFFHGNNKSLKEMAEGLKADIGYFVVDNTDEIDELNEIAIIEKKKAQVLIRVNPGVEAHTHDAVKTGQTDSKFGIGKDSVLDAVKLIKKMPNLKFAGLHAHIGSQIFDTDGYIIEIGVLADLAKKIKRKLKLSCDIINIGGGIGVAYTDGDDPILLSDLAEEIVQEFVNKFSRVGKPMPKLVLEPGRSLVARAGVTLYNIGHIKVIKGVRKYVIVDGGMSDNIRPMLYGSQYQFVAANDMNETVKEKVTIAGRFCESGDVLGKDVVAPLFQKGEIMAVLVTGAYNYSMASNYNRVPRPAMIMVKDGRAKVIVKRESYEDLVKNDAV